MRQISSIMLSTLLACATAGAKGRRAEAGAAGDVPRGGERAGGKFSPAREYGVPGHYLVKLRDAASAEGRGGAARPSAEVARELTRAFGGRVLATWAHALRGFLLEASEEQARRLARHPAVEGVAQDLAVPALSAYPAHCSSDGAVAPRYFEREWGPVPSPQTIVCPSPMRDCLDNWGLDRIGERNLPMDGIYQSGLTGRGVHIYFLDSGIGNNIEFLDDALRSRVGNGVNVYTPNSFPPEPGAVADCAGHGTHVAGIAAGRRYGVARNATLHPVRVSGCNATGVRIAHVFNGVEWIARNHVKPAVVNFSVNIQGPQGADSNRENNVEAVEMMEYAFQRLISYYGVTVVNSAGNHNAWVTDYSPSRMHDVIVVAATNANDERMGKDPAEGRCETVGPSGLPEPYDCLSSNYGNTIDLFAPGQEILSASHLSHKGVCSLTGTSMAAPHVTGAVALYLEANPHATPAEVAQALVGRATPGAVKGNLGWGTPNLLLYSF